ncbi:hypothetical protein DMN91_001628 [Ooceraea biroi]|uniref:Reverse transcriptase domain-containing protein n=1 Tax=Ooceraea biroi TaxID=2015173 RepID=A0A3L8DYV7_OOCBI|nr:uncharacterized protein LOC105282756 [Ooceraea biroi]RLU25472.1 hypothetical protein DMN91_001628 [Ooceraea biroi]
MTTSSLARCYGLPKIHKPGFPLRIIVSAIDTPEYNIAYFFHKILTDSIPKPGSYIKDNWTFVKNIQNLSIGPNEELVSLDVISLFTNIPKELVKKSIKKRWHLINSVTKFNLDQFLYAIDLILTSTSFSFGGQFYNQIFGCPMGSPLSSILADIILDDLESQCIESLDFKVQTFYRYVDDVFTILPKNKIQYVMNIFNSYYPRLQFTCELENNNSMSFLDTIVIRVNNKLITNWYRKPTFSGRYVNYFSSHPLKHKIGVINVW